MSPGSTLAPERGPFVWQQTPNPENELSLFTAHGPKSKGSKAAWSTLSWLIAQVRLDFSEELQDVYLDSLNFYQQILMLLSHSQSLELQSEK